MQNSVYALLVFIVAVTRTSPVEAATAQDGDEQLARDLAGVAPAESSGSSPVVTRVAGDGVKTRPYDPMLYEGSSGGPVKAGDDLECKGGQICCWENGDNSTVTGVKWRSANGNIDPAKFQESFGSQTVPGENFLIAYTDTKMPPKQRALFESCSIQCAEGDVQVRFRYWTTPGITLQVCTRDAFFGDTKSLSNCRSVKMDKQAGEASISVSGGHLLAVDLVASGFTADTGSVVIVDRITVSFRSCSTDDGGPDDKTDSKNIPSPTTRTTAAPTTKTTTLATSRPTTTSTSPRTSPPTSPSTSPTTRPAPPPSGNEHPQRTPGPSVSNDDRSNCQSVRCNFDRDTLCAYKEYRLVRASPLRQTKGFAVRHGRFDNLLTGAVPPADRSAYAGAYLYSQDSATLQSARLELSEPRILRFQVFLGAQGLRMKACLNNEINCPLITDADVRINERKMWKTYNVVLPEHTVQVFFVAENIGDNQGAVGIHNIDLLLPDRNGQLDATHTVGSACQ